MLGQLGQLGEFGRLALNLDGQLPKTLGGRKITPGRMEHHKLQTCFSRQDLTQIAVQLVYLGREPVVFPNATKYSVNKF